MSIRIDPPDFNTSDTNGSYGLWDTSDGNCSASDTTVYFNPTSTSTATGTDDCNESLKHSNGQKAVFHSVKGAKRITDEGHHDEAAVIAGQAGRAFLATEGAEYDAERSASYLSDNFSGDDEAVITQAIARAFDKIDRGSHTAGARIAISVADEFVRGFEAP